ncbi:MAG TPA: alkaline phosphatase D family protein [Burkholderiaceae bacterium]
MKRRQFLRGAVYFTVASAGLGLAGCGGSDAASNDAPGQDAPGNFIYPLGVASGDPKEASVVLWTRVLRSAPGAGDIALRLEVSATSTFAQLAASVPLTAGAVYDYTVRAKVTNLLPDTRYFYRFVAGSDVSAVGQTRTAPAASSARAQLRFAWMTCQDWSINHWAGMELLAQEDLDFIVHLGDYIYETVDARFQAGAAEPAHGPIRLPNSAAVPAGGTYADTLADYRTLYNTYRGDPRLQELHRRFPMIAIWDDHEFSDDCWQDHQSYDNANKQETQRRLNATQAWAEYMPIDFGDVSFDLAKGGYDNIRIYRDFRFGSLMHLVMTDQRLYRDDHVVTESGYAQLVGHDPVNGADSVGARYFVPQQLLREFETAKVNGLGRAPSILGATQTQWWKDTMKGSTSAWRVWGNEVTLNRMWLDMRTSAPAPYNNLYIVNADTWDGYPRHKAELLGYLRAQNIANTVAITGDLHAFQCGVVRDNPDPAVGVPVAVDFVGAGISSSSFYSYLKSNAGSTPLAALVATPQTYDAVMRANNPDFAYVDHDAQGFAIATVTASSFSVTFNKLRPLNADGTKPASPLLKRTRISVQSGSTRPVVEDNV